MRRNASLSGLNPRLGLLLGGLGLVLYISSCQWETRVEPSVLVIAVDSLPYESVNCLESDDTNSSENGFQVLCRESVRFTHAFTPSPMAGAAVVSLLTGLWPFEHGVRDNGATPLSAKWTTVAEAAYAKGFRTAFFSGGPPIFRKSGVAQGFEVFDDFIQPRSDRLYRNFSGSLAAFRQWYSLEVGGKSFFSVFYVPDLQIFDVPTLDEKGRIVERSYSGRVRSLQTSLAELFDFLKKKNHWNNSYVILVGLNGYSDLERFNEIPSTNLHIENTQVALLIKPPQKDRDLGLSWKIDSNVSLADVAQTLFQIFEAPVPERSEASLFPTYSLSSALKSAESDWPHDRLIPVESYWAKWKEVGPIKWAVRSAQQMVLFEEEPRVFNTLTDRLELNPMKPSGEWIDKIKVVRESLPIESWPGLPQNLLHQVDVAINIWDPSGRSGIVQQENENNPTVAGWLAIRAMEQRDWPTLLRLAKLQKNRYWEGLAQTYLEDKSVYPDQGCFKWAKSNSDLKNIKDCNDPLFRNLVQWIRKEQSSEESHLDREAVVRGFRNLILDRRVLQLNYVNGLCWDVSSIYTQGPTLSEIFLNYPDNRKYWTQLQERLKSQSLDSSIY